MRTVRTLLAILSIAAPVGAQSLTPRDTFQPWRSVMYRLVQSAVVSPDGRQTAFLRSVPRRPMADDSGAPTDDELELERDMEYFVEPEEALGPRTGDLGE